jgi:hypothetical protein
MEEERVGTERIYAVELATTFGSDHEDADRSLDLAGTARLKWTLVEKSAEGDLFAGQALDFAMSASRGSELGRPFDASLREQLGKPFYVRRAPSGQIKLAYVTPDLQPMGHKLLAGILSALQFVRPGRERELPREWTVEEADHAAIWRAYYHRLDDGPWEKKREVFTSLRMELPVTQGTRPIASGTTTFRLGSSGAVEEADMREHSRFQFGDGTLETRTSISLRQTSTRLVGVEPHRLASLREIDVYALPSATDDRTAEAADHERLRAIPTATALDELGRAARAGDQQKQLDSVEMLGAVIAHNPESIPEVVRRLRRSGHASERNLLLSALGEAHTPESQAALAELAGDGLMDNSTRHSALTHLALENQPTNETLASLRTLATSDQAQESERRLATLALGATAGQAEAGEDTREAGMATVKALSESAVAATEPRDKALYLDALGNAGTRDAIEVIQKGLTDSSPTVRAAATLALRKLEGVEVEQLLLSTLSKDQDASVRSAAITAIQNRELTPLLTQALIQSVKTESDAALRSQVVGVLGQKALDQQPVRDALAWVGKNDTDAEVRRAAEGLIQGPQMPAGATSASAQP